MSQSGQIRRARVADARAIAQIHVETWRAAYAGILPDRVMLEMSVDSKTAHWRRAIEKQGSHELVLVAEVPLAGLVGFASCARGGPGAPVEGGEVQTLYVLPDWQEQGYGRRLLCNCLRTIRSAAMNGAYAWVLAANHSRFFYEAMGGQRIGERVERLWGVDLPEIAYGWRDLTRLPDPCRRRG
ncbi:MAG: GNAT family N-acetyltransferase [Dongiaceae bacterium]